MRSVLVSLLLVIIAVVPAPAAAQTPSPEGQTFAFPWPPDWVPILTVMAPRTSADTDEPLLVGTFEL